jgi:hypothetical protein
MECVKTTFFKKALVGVARFSTTKFKIVCFIKACFKMTSRDASNVFHFVGCRLTCNFAYLAHGGPAF